MTLSKAPKVQYTEFEAAALLGISIEHLRELVRLHIVKEESDASNLEYTSFQQSDLLLLKILASQGAGRSTTANGM